MIARSDQSPSAADAAPSTATLDTQRPHAITWPASSCYWSVLPDPAGRALRRPGPLPPSLLAEFADDAPTLIEELHAVGVGLEDGRLLVCAASRAELAAVDPNVRELTPRSIPEALGIMAPHAPLNLLVGAFEPLALRRARTRTHGIAAVLILICTAMIAVGLHRRASHANQLAANSQTAAHELALATLGDGNASNPAAALALERARTQQLAGLVDKVEPPTDAALTFAALLRSWPTQVASRPQSLRVGHSGASASLLIENDAAPMLRAFRPPEGWVLAEPRVSASGNAVRVALEMTRAERAPNNASESGSSATAARIIQPQGSSSP